VVLLGNIKVLDTFSSHQNLEEELPTLHFLTVSSGYLLSVLLKASES
jgi:hypothetical protein